MSTERWDHNGVQVSTFAGGVSLGSQDRRRMQIHVQGRFVNLTMPEWESLMLYARLVGNEPYEYEWLDREYDRGVVRDGIMVCVDLGRKSCD